MDGSHLGPFQTENRRRCALRSRVTAFVDFRAIAERLKTQDYTGDLLLENTPTAHSLQDALRSREYLLNC